MRTSGRIMVAALAAALAGAIWSGPSWAAESSDLQVKSQSVTGKIGQVVFLPVMRINNGPDPTITGSVYYEFVAPRGTEFENLKNFRANSYCSTVTKTRIRCRSTGMIYPKTEQMGWPSWGHLELKIVSRVTGPGLYRITCACDPKTSNNSTLLVVNGVRSVIKPSPKPASPKPAQSPKAAASPTAPPSPTASGPAPSASPSPGASAAGVPASAGSLEPELMAGDRRGGLLGPGVIVVLLGLLGLGVAAYLRRSRRASAADTLAVGALAADTPAAGAPAADTPAADTPADVETTG